MISYAFDIALFIQRILPPLLNLPLWNAWMYCLVKPVYILHQDFLAYRDDINDQLSYNSQTMIFEYLLNLKFNSGGTEIYITNILNDSPAVYLGHLSDDRSPVYIGNLADNGPDIYLGHVPDYILGNYDFIVNVPSALVYDATMMNALIEKYKIAGKRYTIQTY